MFNSPFQVIASIPDDAQIIFVGDNFVEDYVGGAELTTEALIDESPYKTHKLRCKDVTLDLLRKGAQKYWIFTNFSQLDPQLIPSIVGNLNYSVIEYDYKYCRYRSVKKHEAAEGQPCNCHNEERGKLVSAFYYGARNLWWMSEGQMQHYHTLFPFLASKNNTVLSSVFSKPTLAFMNELNKQKVERNEKYIVLKSPSWIKGYPQAVQFCKEHNLEYEEVWGLKYEALLGKLAQSKGLVYLPQDNDTCPRLVIEAKLLGCDLVINNNVQHYKEEWFAADNAVEIAEYLFAAPTLFWGTIKETMEHKATLSGYTTTLNCIDQNYPFEHTITSLLSFCDEVVVVDGGSTDGTWEALEVFAASHDKLKIHQQKRDWNCKRFAVFDGLQKALARSLCTKEFCWQMDSDEVVHPDDHAKIRDLMAGMPQSAELFALPVIEYWGNGDKVRMDVNPWKWRLSRNLPHITHGIPAELRKFDEEGELYAEQGTDGCDYVRFDNYHRITCHTFYTADVEAARQAAVAGNGNAKNEYVKWLTSVCAHLPAVYHFSWWDIERKIHTYKNYWSRHWESLYDIPQEDTAENNKFFDVPWSEVTDEMITARAKELEEGTGGWVFHSKWNGYCVPHIELDRQYPESMKGWCNAVDAV